MNSQSVRVPSSQYRIKTCRICGSTALHTFLKLGAMPIPNGFIPKKDIHKKEFFFPLDVCICKICFLVQLTHVIPASIMFKNYLYIPSTSQTVVKHFTSFADDVVRTYSLTNDDLVIDIGSNDGTLLAAFQKHKIRVLGIDPAENIAKKAVQEGIPTRCAFFTENEATFVRREYGPARVITGTNVIAHIDTLHDVMNGVTTLLADDGIFVMEAPYLMDLLERNEFDTIYHEHLSYFSVAPLQTLFTKHGLKIIDIQKQSIHGGTIRVFVAREESWYETHPRVEKFLVEEKAKGLQTIKTYEDFAQRVGIVKKELVRFLKKLRRAGKSIAGYGAAAKGNVLLNSSKIDTNLIDFIVDSIHYKQGKYTPGTHIPIYSEDKLLKNMPDYTLILAWNFADEIIEKNQEYLARGGRFIIPVPYLKVI